MARKPPQMTDTQRHELEAAIAAALLLIAQGRRAEAFTALGKRGRAAGLSDAQTTKLQAFAAERAQLVQDGVNQRLQNALDALPDDASAEDQDAAIATAQSEIDTHNHDTLIPFLAGTAGTLGMLSAYEDTPSPEDATQSMADTSQWNWVRVTDNPPDDECQDAMEASPASLDELIAIAGGSPPIHPNCSCSLEVA